MKTHFSKLSASVPASTRCPLVLSPHILLISRTFLSIFSFSQRAWTLIYFVCFPLCASLFFLFVVRVVEGNFHLESLCIELYMACLLCFFFFSCCLSCTRAPKRAIVIELQEHNVPLVLHWRWPCTKLKIEFIIMSSGWSIAEEVSMVGRLEASFWVPDTENPFQQL